MFGALRFEVRVVGPEQPVPRGVMPISSRNALVAPRRAEEGVGAEEGGGGGGKALERGEKKGEPGIGMLTSFVTTEGVEEGLLRGGGLGPGMVCEPL